MNIANALEILSRPFFVRFGHTIYQNGLKLGADFKSAILLLTSLIVNLGSLPFSLILFNFSKSYSSGSVLDIKEILMKFHCEVTNGT